MLDQTLVNTLCGLNPKYHNVASIVTMQVPFPDFLRVRSYLLEENRFEQMVKFAVTTAFYSQSSSSHDDGRGDRNDRSDRKNRKPKNKHGGNERPLPA